MSIQYFGSLFNIFGVYSIFWASIQYIYIYFFYFFWGGGGDETLLIWTAFSILLFSGHLSNK